MTTEITETVELIPLTSLVPDEWTHWFYGRISEDAPFSWGDNNRTLVTASRLLSHAIDRLDDVSVDEGVPQEDVDFFLKTIEGLGEAYVDLEN